MDLGGNFGSGARCVPAVFWIWQFDFHYRKFSIENQKSSCASVVSFQIHVVIFKFSSLRSVDTLRGSLVTGAYRWWITASEACRRLDGVVWSLTWWFGTWAVPNRTCDMCSGWITVSESWRRLEGVVWSLTWRSNTWWSTTGIFDSLTNCLEMPRCRFQQEYDFRFWVFGQSGFRCWWVEFCAEYLFVVAFLSIFHQKFPPQRTRCGF